MPPPRDPPAAPGPATVPTSLAPFGGAAPAAAGGLASEPPEVIAGYRRIRLLGCGGMGLVYEVQDLAQDRRAALKLLKPAFASDPEIKERFLREAKAMAQVRHDHVIALYGAGEEAGMLYLVMEFIPGADLARMLVRRGMLEAKEAVAIARQCCLGLEAIAAAGLVHRDIKPQNIFINRVGIAKIGDLGLARRSDGGDRMTMTGVSWGTPAYMSAEQIRGLADIDIRSDIYSLGATLFSMVCGVDAFSGATQYVVTTKVLTEPVPDPRQHNRLVPAALAAIIGKAMAKDRAERYQTPGDLLADLERFASDQRLLHAAVPEAPSGPAPASEAVALRHGHGGRGVGFGGLIAQLDPMVLRAGALVLVLVVLGLVAHSLGTLPPPVAPALVPAPAAGQPPAGAPGLRSAWMAAAGQDARGRWAEVAVGTQRFRLRYCPSGRFLMGSPPDEAGREACETQHPVVLSRGFWLMETECTRAQWQAVMGGTAPERDAARLPQALVTWTEAQDFCSQLARRVPGVAVRLPSEAEWEYACRAGSATPYAGGRPLPAQGWAADGDLLSAWQESPEAARAVVEATPRAPNHGAHVIADLLPNAWGFCDLHGNVAEWCADTWDGRSAYAADEAVDPLETHADLVVVRGGAWFLPPGRCRAASRCALPANQRCDWVGLRVAMEESRAATQAHPSP